MASSGLRIRCRCVVSSSGGALLPHLHAGPAEHRREGLKATWERTVLLVLAVVLHNIPEGLAVGVAFGAAAAAARSFLPYVLGFAAGAMVYVVIEELIPASQEGGNANVATLGAVAGFLTMMVLDLLVDAETGVMLH